MTFAFKKLGVREKTLLFILAMILLNLLFYFGIYAPQQMQMTELAEELQTNQSKISVIEAFIAKHPDIAAYDAALDEQWRIVSKSFPEEPAISEVLGALEKISQESQMQLVAMQPSQEAADQKEPKRYQEIVLKLKVKGTYFQLLDFLKNMESMERFATVQSITSRSTNGVLESELSVVVYCYGNKQKAKSAEETSPAKSTASNSR